MSRIELGTEFFCPSYVLKLPKSNQFFSGLRDRKAATKRGHPGVRAQDISLTHSPTLLRALTSTEKKFMARGNCGRRRKKRPWTICLLSGSLIGGAVFHLAKRVIVSKHLFQILVSRDTFSIAAFVLFCYLVNIERRATFTLIISLRVLN